MRMRSAQMQADTGTEKTEAGGKDGEEEWKAEGETFEWNSRLRQVHE